MRDHGTNCLGYQQLQNEVEAVRTAHALPAGLGTSYFLFTAPHESSCYATTACFTADGTSTANSAYCAFHSYYFEGTDPVMWANMPYGAYTSAGCTVLSAFPTTGTQTSRSPSRVTNRWRRRPIRK